MRITLTLVVLAFCVMAYGQDTAELERRNGFKTILLGTPVDSIKGAEFKKDLKEHDEFPVKLYVIKNEEYKAIGEVQVKDIEVKTYQGIIYEIHVETEKDPRVMRALEKSFGKGTYIVRTLLYKWFTPKISLTFQVHRNSLELVYRGHPVIQKMYADKGKKVDDIAEGF